MDLLCGFSLVPMSGKSAVAAASPLAASAEEVPSYGVSQPEAHPPEPHVDASPLLGSLASPLAPSESSSSILLRQRSQSEVMEPWDVHVRDGGGQATYLPAIPVASASPAPKRASSDARRAAGKAISRESSTLGEFLLNADEGEHGSDAAAGVPSESPDVEVGGGEDDGEDADDAEADSVPSYQPPPVSNLHKLGQWQSTAICGNDITSSCLYVTGLCVADAGIWAPICLLMVGVTLYLFRAVYGEAVTALPLNGGAYNVLL